MLFLEKLIPSFLIPPGLFFILLFIMLFLLKKLKVLLILHILLLFLIYSTSISIVADTLIGSLEKRYPPLRENIAPNGDVYIVLGGGIIENNSDTQNGATLSAESLKRLFFAYSLYKRTPHPIIVTGGKSYIKKGTFSEGFIAAQYLYDLNVQRSDVIVESKSKNTIENAHYVAQLIKQFGFNSPILITSAYHMPRSVYAFKKQTINVIPAPTDYHTENLKRNILDFIPSIEALNNAYRFMHESLGLIYYRIIL
jgi:uncharacterized SAM-binding protein YcdF (DUF218 family)